MKTFQEFMLVVEGMTLADYKKQKSRQKQKDKREALKTSPTRRKGIHNPSASPERAARHRTNVDPDFEGDDESNYPGGRLRPNKVRKAKALGELGESYFVEAIRNPESRKKLRDIEDREVRKGDKKIDPRENPRSKYPTEKGKLAGHLLRGPESTGSKGNPVRSRGGTNAPADERVGRGPHRAGNAAYWAGNAGPNRDRGAGNKAARRAGKSVQNTRDVDEEYDLSETSLTRVMSKSQKGGMAIMSAQRGDKSKAENKARSKQLEKDVRGAGLPGPTKVSGRYTENPGTSQEKKVGEKSHIITPGKRGKRKFKKAIEKLGKKYDQDSVLLQRKGGGSSTLKGTSKTSWPGEGKNVKIGKMKPGRTGEFDTKVKNKTFTVED